MQKADRYLAKWWYLAFFLVAGLVVTADQLTKLWIRTNYHGQPLYELGFIRIIFIQNTGAAFGIFHNQNFTLTIVDFVGIVLILLFIFLIPRYYPVLLTRTGMIALAMIWGGTIGNLIGRLARGYVTDFIDVGFWPVFNVADSCVVVGTILFAITILFASRNMETEK